MKRYTVILLYPDYMNDTGQETYITKVEGEDLEDAWIMAQAAAVVDNDMEFEEADDFAVLATFDGHVQEAAWPR